MALGAIPAALLLLGASGACSSQSDEFPADLGRWWVAPRPKALSDERLAAQNDEHEWVVTLGEAAPRVGLLGREPENPTPLPFEIEPGSAKEGLSGTRKSIRVEDGWIVGFNAGEFGAGLWWFSPDGKTRRKISSHHVIEFFQASSRSPAWSTAQAPRAKRFACPGRKTAVGSLGRLGISGKLLWSRPGMDMIRSWS